MPGFEMYFLHAFLLVGYPARVECNIQTRLS
jgi:hypothetical protein